MGKKNRGSRNKAGAGKGDWREDDTPKAFHNPFAALAGRTATEPGPQETSEPVADDVEEASSPPARAVVRLEKKGRGGKRVTVVQHLGLPAAVLNVWCRELRTQMGCGGQVEDDTLVLHGDQRERLVRALEARGVGRVTRG
jgi:translation initiation factor 1